MTLEGERRLVFGRRERPSLRARFNHRRDLDHARPIMGLASEWLSAPSAAAGLAMINAIGTLFGFFCNWMVSAIKQATGSYPLAFTPIVGFVVAACVVLLLIGRPQPAAA